MVSTCVYNPILVINLLCPGKDIAHVHEEWLYQSLYSFFTSVNVYSLH